MGILGVYAVYLLTTASAVEVPKIQASSVEPTVLIITLHNPTLKFVTGQLLSVGTEVDITPSRSGSARVLASVPQTYPFAIFPGSSTELTVAMNFRVLPGVDYDILLQIDGVGQKTATVRLPG